MRESLARSITMSNVKGLIGSLAQDNHYIVTFSSLTPSVESYLSSYTGIGNIKSFLSRRAGILCSDANLPTTAYATAEVKDNFMGIPQQFAHTRLYTDTDFSFYIDEDYTLLKMFEGWMEYISSGSDGSVSQSHRAYYKRMRYPDTYKCNTMYINKFEKNYKRSLRYQFVNVFPKSMGAIPVSYKSADLLKVTVSFNFDRYIING